MPEFLKEIKKPQQASALHGKDAHPTPVLWAKNDETDEFDQELDQQLTKFRSSEAGVQP